MYKLTSGPRHPEITNVAEAWVGGSFKEGFPQGTAGAALIWNTPRAGWTALARPPGIQSPYRAELLALWLAGTLLPQSVSKVVSDCKAAIKVVSGCRQIVWHRSLARRAREVIQRRGLSVVWTKAQGTEANERVDELANTARELPPQSKEWPVGPLDLTANGELQTWPHKCWTRLKVPHHTHRDTPSFLKAGAGEV